MRLPRDLSGRNLAKALNKVGYAATRQTGSHIRLTMPAPGEHHVTVPDHDPIRVGTLAGVLSDVVRIISGSAEMSWLASYSSIELFLEGVRYRRRS